LVCGRSEQFSTRWHEELQAGNDPGLATRGHARRWAASGAEPFGLDRIGHRQGQNEAGPAGRSVFRFANKFLLEFISINFMSQ